MINARRALAAAGLILLPPPAAVSFAGEPAVETTVELQSPERATVRTRIPSGHPFAGDPGFHGLMPDRENGWGRVAMRAERTPDGGLAFRSEVEVGAGGWMRIPIPLPDVPPARGTDLTFAAEISPPPGYRVVDAFPAGSGEEAGGATIRMLLPAPPSFLRFRVIPEDAMGLGLSGLVDGAVALLFLGLAGFGVRRLFGSPVPSRDASR